MAIAKVFTIPATYSSITTLSVLATNDTVIKCVYHDLNVMPSQNGDVPFWTVDIKFTTKSYVREFNGVVLTNSLSLLGSASRRMPFRIVVSSTVKGCDPFLLNDFETGRCSFMFVFDD